MRTAFVPNLNSSRLAPGTEVLHPVHGYGDVLPFANFEPPLFVRVDFPGRGGSVQVVRRDMLSVKRRIDGGVF